MMLADKLREALRRDEGSVLHLYYDHGVPHIGVGCNLMVPVPQDIAVEITITPAAADALLTLRIGTAATGLYQALPWTLQLDEPRQAALIQIVYNMGIGNFLHKNAEAVKAIQLGDYAKAKGLLLGGTWEQQVGARAVRLCNKLLTGEWE